MVVFAGYLLEKLRYERWLQFLDQWALGFEAS